PQSKFIDIVYNASRVLTTIELDRIMKRQAILEMMVEEKYGEDFNKLIIQRLYSDVDNIEEKTKSLYIESVGNILSQNE
ncbi:MAG: DUF2018 family protein, partial [Campylobacterota bacterium]|nr:DUF2018 family protein [Campylobacterota bacterium]